MPGFETHETDDQSRRRSAEDIDYVKIVNGIADTVWRLPQGSVKRARMVENLDVYLYPKRDKRFMEDLQQLRHELAVPNGGPISDRAGYSDGFLKILLSLMQRSGLLGRTRIEEEF